MILADKILNLRKKNGWSQEELAEQMNVSRQSVSKWESAQSIPDLDKILQLSKIFGVSTDYLIKDEIELEEKLDIVDDYQDVKTISLEEANRFLDERDKNKGLIANAVSLFIFCPWAFLILMGLIEENLINLSENAAMGIGVSILLIQIALGIFMAIKHNQNLEEFEYLEKENIETLYGVDGMVRERKSAYKDTYTRNLSLGICMCILSVIPIFIGINIGENSEIIMILSIVMLLLIVSLGVNLIIRNSIKWDSYNILLEEGDFTRKSKNVSSYLENIGGIYWLLVIALFIGSGLMYDAWDRNWVIFPLAGILFGVVSLLVEMIKTKE